jgi:hypothetical protein
MGNVPLEVLFNECLLSRRTFTIEVDYDEVNPTLILLVEAYGAASLPLGIESALAEHKDVIRLAPDGSVFDVIAGDERTVMAIARVVELRIQPQVFDGLEQDGKREEDCQQHQK